MGFVMRYLYYYLHDKITAYAFQTYLCRIAIFLPKISFVHLTLCAVKVFGTYFLYVNTKIKKILVLEVFDCCVVYTVILLKVWFTEFFLLFLAISNFPVVC